MPPPLSGAGCDELCPGYWQPIANTPPTTENPLKTILLLLTLFFTDAKVWASDLSSYAFVNDDGSLRINNRTVRLAGIIIPPSRQACQSNILPPLCAPRAVLALKLKIGVNFVHCDIKARLPTSEIIAYCTVNEEDLAAWLIQRGWAVAAPEAPATYTVLEKIARHQNVGLWGTPLNF